MINYKKANSFFDDGVIRREYGANSGDWTNEFKEIREKMLTEYYIKYLEENYNNDSYYTLTKLINSFINNELISDNNTIIDYIVEKDFLPPDLSLDISLDKWKYSVEIA